MQVCRNLFGLNNNGELRFKDFLAMVHPDDHKLVETILLVRSGLESVESIEYRIRRPDGSIRWISSEANSQSARLINHLV